MEMSTMSSGLKDNNSHHDYNYNNNNNHYHLSNLLKLIWPVYTIGLLFYISKYRSVEGLLKGYNTGTFQSGSSVK